MIVLLIAIYLIALNYDYYEETIKIWILDAMVHLQVINSAPN